MKSPLVYSALGTLAFALLLSGCKSKKDDGAGPALVPVSVRISGCIPNPDEARVKDTGTVSFIPDVTYQVTFIPTNTPTGPAVPVSQNPFVIQGGTTIPKVMHGPSNCTADGCLYKYKLNRMNGAMPIQPPCIDPGIRIIP